jgi:hypothetical protein
LLPPAVVSADIADQTAVNAAANRGKRPAMAIAQCGAVVSSGQLTIPIDGSDDGSTWVDNIATLACTTQNSIVRASLPAYQYYRAAASSDHSGTSIAVGVSVVIYKAEK